MDINYEYYKIFYNVAKYGGFTVAAEKTYSNQPNLTRTIKKLEQELGVALFYKAGRNVRLTPEGEELYARIRVAVEQIENAEREISEFSALEGGYISVSASEAALHKVLLPALGAYKKAHPKITILLYNHSSPQALAALKNGQCEIAVISVAETFDPAFEYYKIAACLGLLISCVGADPMTSYDRFTFGVHRLYLGLDLAVTLIGLFALVEIIGKAELKRSELNLHAGKIGNDDGKITKDEYKRMLRPVLIGSLIGSCVGIVPGTGASEASWFSYNTAKNMSKHPEEFGHGSVEGVAAAESANNAVCGATLIPLLTLGIPGDGCVAIMLSALMINGLNPGLSLFTTDGAIMYAIMLGLILVNIFMFLQGKYLTSLFAKVVSIPQQILTPIIVIFCFAGAYSVNSSYFDLSVALVFGVMAWFMRKLELPAVPVLLGMVLGNMTETNFRRALLISDGSPRIFVSSVYCWIFIALIVVVILGILRGKMKEAKNTKAEQ